MAARLERAFGADAKKLLKLQADYDQSKRRHRIAALAITPYVPPFLKITADQISRWATTITARSTFPVLLRRLVNSTGRSVTFVDFPGYDMAERPGWDGRVECTAPTQWLPCGVSCWELGCSSDPGRKARSDYEKRTREVPPGERRKAHFVFATPQIWRDKQRWVDEMQASGEWRSVRAYDANDLEHWLEQSLPAQRWLAEQLDIPQDGVYSLEDRWRDFALQSTPPLTHRLFDSAVLRFRSLVLDWISSPDPQKLLVAADSRIEALAFLFCLFEQEDFHQCRDRILVFSSGPALKRLTTPEPPFIPVVFTDEAERALSNEYNGKHAVIVRHKLAPYCEPAITLDVLDNEGFRKGLEAMGITDHLEIDKLGRESGYSPTILRRRLSTVPAIQTPTWAKDAETARRLIPMMLAGAWNVELQGDREAIESLSQQSADQIEATVAEFLQLEDSPIWRSGYSRGVASRRDALFAVAPYLTRNHIQTFTSIAYSVLAEADPTLELSDDEKPFAVLYNKSRLHSDSLRRGLCVSLALLHIHGGDVLQRQTGYDPRRDVESLIRRLLTPLTPDLLYSQQDLLPLYAEAAPETLLAIIEDDLGSVAPATYSLICRGSSGVFGSCPRSGLLWALEVLAWDPLLFSRVSLILAQLATLPLLDNWSNTAFNSLAAVFRFWMPQTTADVSARIKALEVVVHRFPVIGWKLCIAQLACFLQTGTYSSRPKWRQLSKGAGHPISSTHERDVFRRKALDLALGWATHDEHTLGDLVATLNGLSEADQTAIWDQIDRWAMEEKDDKRKAALRAQIRLLTVRMSREQDSIESKSRARSAYEALAPTDPSIGHAWLFENHWLAYSYQELQEGPIEHLERDAKVESARRAALSEIWQMNGAVGVKSLVETANSPFTVGSTLACLKNALDLEALLLQLLDEKDPVKASNIDEAIRGLLARLNPQERLPLIDGLIHRSPTDAIRRILRSSPFGRETWKRVASRGAAVEQQYWREIHPGRLGDDRAELNDAVDCLLAARRPRAAFYCVEFALEHVETSRLRRIVYEVRTVNEEEPGTYLVEAYHLSQALDILQTREDISEEEMASLEFLHVDALEHQKHGIPNLEKQLSRSPALFVRALALAFGREDGKTDPPEWGQVGEASGLLAHRLLRNVKRIPGASDRDSCINKDALRTWVSESRSLAAAHGRADRGDEYIGIILSASPTGEDGIWPCVEVREVIEEAHSYHLGRGVLVGVQSSFGVYIRHEGGTRERQLASRYQHWADDLLAEYPHTSEVVRRISRSYEDQARREELSVTASRRLRS